MVNDSEHRREMSTLIITLIFEILLNTICIQLQFKYRTYYIYDYFLENVAYIFSDNIDSVN